MFSTESQGWFTMQTPPPTFSRITLIHFIWDNPTPSFSSPHITIQIPEIAIRGLSNSMKFAVPSHQTITYYTPPLALKHFCTHPLFYVAEQARFNIHYFKQECTTCLLAVWKDCELFRKSNPKDQFPETWNRCSVNPSQTHNFRDLFICNQCNLEYGTFPARVLNFDECISIYNLEWPLIRNN